MIDPVELARNSAPVNLGLFGGALAEITRVISDRDLRRAAVDLIPAAVTVAIIGGLSDPHLSQPEVFQNYAIAFQLGINLGSLFNSIIHGEKLVNAPLFYGFVPGALLGFLGEWTMDQAGKP